MIPSCQKWMKISQLSIRERLGMEIYFIHSLHSPRVKLVGLILTLTSNLQLSKNPSHL